MLQFVHMFILVIILVFGNDCDIYTGAVVHENCILGNRVVLRAKAVIGGEGFGFATENGVHTHISTSR